MNRKKTICQHVLLRQAHVSASFMLYPNAC